MMFFRDKDFDPLVKEEQLESSDLLLNTDNTDAELVECSQPANQGINATGSSQTEGSRSMYVTKLLEMIDTVLEHESHLFDSSEITILNGIKRANYFQQYLISRIVQRTRGKWLRFDQLNKSYAPEFRKHAAESDVPKIMADTLLELSGRLHLEEGPCFSSSEKNVIDLTLDSDDEDACSPKRNDSYNPTRTSDEAATSCSGSISEPVVFLEDTSTASPAQLLECLNVEELKLMGKRLKIPSKAKLSREELIKSILLSTSTQTTLPFAIVNKTSNSSSKRDSNDWRKLFPFKPPQAPGKPQNMPLQERRIRDMCNELYGACFRLLDSVVQVLHLVSVVYFRSTEQSEANSIMLSAILSLSGKRNYPTYEYKRTTDIFPERTDLLRYMETSLLLNEVENILAGAGQPQGAKFDRLKASQDVINIWETHRDRWNLLVAYLKDKSHRERGLERFEEGYLLTRLAYKAAECFGKLKKFDAEAKLLVALLRQTRWRRSKRGRWYDRLALIYTKYMGGEANLPQAREYLLTGLKDELVSIGSYPMLLRRLQRLEKQLRLPIDEQYAGGGGLRDAVETQIEGTRIYTPQTPVAQSKGTEASPKAAPSTMDKAILMHFSGSPSSSLPMGNSNQRPKSTGKTLWAGEQGEVNVEAFALEYYARLGFKGFHSEGAIVSTLFGLLFWDILFAPTPGAFETPYQSAPLDLAHDSFFGSREEIINARLLELRNTAGAARQIVENVYRREREREPWCVGVRWDLFEHEEELIEIVECLGGPALAAICRLLAEEYGSRGGGVPDLFIWNATEKTCKFVEVKGPGDNLSETQRVWIDVLLNAGVDVEVCRVYEYGKVPTRAAKDKNKTKGGHQRRSASRKRTPKESEDVLEEFHEPDPEDEDELQRSIPICRTDHTHTALLRPITSMPAPVLPDQSSKITLGRVNSTISSITGGTPATQETVIPETPQATQQQPLAGGSTQILGDSPVIVQVPEPHPVPRPKAVPDSRLPLQPAERSNSSPRKSHLPTNKEWRDMLKVTPAKKTPKREAIASPLKYMSPVTESSSKRKRIDSTIHTPTCKPASTSVAIDMPGECALDANTEETTRTLRKRRRTTSAQVGVSMCPTEWEKKWPDVFPQWVGDLGESSDPDYEPSQ